MPARRFVIGAMTDKGNLKTSNQDNILVKVGEGREGEFALFLVADGMGGLAAGEIASRIIADDFSFWWSNNLSDLIHKDENLNMGLLDFELNNLVKSINGNIIDFGRSINEKAGSTLSMLFVYKNYYVIKHIGDSRIYLINNTVTRLTEDHSWVAQQVKEGRLTEAEAKVHPKRNVLTRCLGVVENIQLYEKHGEVEPEDSFLICSDGFYNYVDEGEILESVSNCKKEDGDVQECLAKLLEEIKLRGAHDNVSAVLVNQCIVGSDGMRFPFKGVIKKITDSFVRW